MCRLRIGLLSAALMVVFAGTAQSQTASISVSEGTSVLLPPLASVSQPALSRSENADVKSGQLNVSIGKRFTTQIEGSTIGDRPIANFPNTGVAATSVMLNGLYEVSNGTWHLKPYVGGGFGFVDANAHVLGKTDNDWQTAYQLHGGVQVGLTQKLVGSLEYRFTSVMSGFKPTKFNVNSHGFSIGFNYKY